MFDFERIRLDFRSKEPIYTQLAALLRSEMDLGQIQPGEQLPTVRVLASMLGINFNTVARAYRVLDIEGRISTQQGRGTFVTDPYEKLEISNQGAITTQRFVDQVLAQAVQVGIEPEDLIQTLRKQVHTRQDSQAKTRPIKTVHATRYLRMPRLHPDSPFTAQTVRRTIRMLRKRRRLH
jgi:GntR family transcriptional regulator